MPGMKRVLLVMCFCSFRLLAADTLYKHPFYPPLIFDGDEYNFYKYTPKYVPENLLHCFKILATVGEENLERFSKRSQEEVIERGIFDRGYRLRKEFCLEGYSPFTRFFHKRGIYYPYAMQTYILLSFHQYLNGVSISWSANKSEALKNLRRENRFFQKQARQLVRSLKEEPIVVEEEPIVTDEDWFFQW
jgi:hypothetical protein